MIDANVFESITLFMDQQKSLCKMFISFKDF